MKPTQLKRSKTGTLDIIWDDAKECSIPLTFLRDQCPCAMCSGESLFLDKHYAPPPQAHLPGRYELKGLNAVGTYAVGAQWGDGHNTGIYTWEYLRRLCDAVESAQKNTSA